VKEKCSQKYSSLKKGEGETKRGGGGEWVYVVLLIVLTRTELIIEFLYLAMFTHRYILIIHGKLFTLCTYM